MIFASDYEVINHRRLKTVVVESELYFWIIELFISYTDSIQQLFEAPLYLQNLVEFFQYVLHSY